MRYEPGSRLDRFEIIDTLALARVRLPTAPNHQLATLARLLATTDDLLTVARDRLARALPE